MSAGAHAAFVSGNVATHQDIFHPPQRRCCHASGSTRMAAGASDKLTEVWSAGTIVLSYVIAVTGSFCTIQIMEQWRMQESPKQKRLLLVLASTALGGCAIWAMHFTGMQASTVYHPDGSDVQVDFEGGMTILSLIFPIVGVFIGLTIASRDPFFLEMEITRRKSLLADQMKGMTITEMLNKDAVQRKIKFIALFSRLWRILLGGLWAALGVLGMHYLGMMGQRSEISMSFDGGLVALSCIIAFVAATAAFWIIFRALTFWPNVDALRIGSALVMGIAVCGTHYTGMAAAEYTHDPDHSPTSGGGFVIHGDTAFNLASNGSLVLCFWMVSISVVRDLRVNAVSSRTNSQPQTSAGGASKKSDHGQSFHNSSVPRNAVLPMKNSNSRTASVETHLKNNVVARLAQKQHPLVMETENQGEPHEAFENVVPGRV